MFRISLYTRNVGTLDIIRSQDRIAYQATFNTNGNREQYSDDYEIHPADFVSFQYPFTEFSYDDVTNGTFRGIFGIDKPRPNKRKLIQGRDNFTKIGSFFKDYK